MRTTNFKAAPMSRQSIRAIVKIIKKKCGLENELKIPVCSFFEFIMERLFPNFEWEIVDEYKMKEEGLTLSANNTIYIRQDVYIKACHGDGRARFTIMHEIGHFFLHGPKRVALCRLAPGKQLKKYEDPEWQADNFAAEFLMDSDLVIGMDFLEISSECGVTYGASQTRINILEKEFN